MNKNKIIITPMGGLAEFGKNMLLLEISNEMLIIDCGIKLLKDFYGLNGEIVDLRFLLNNKEKIKGLLITHGHLDHIGGVSFLLNEIELPVYSSNFAASIIRSSLLEYGIKKPNLIEIEENTKFSIGNFLIDPITVNHSIVESFAFAIKTEIGTIIHSGDFKCDFTPYETNKTDLKKFEKYGKDGVLALFSDSTGAPKEGINRSEKEVFENLNTLFEKYKNNRLIIATFSTQINRIQQILDLAKKYKKKIVFSGRSMQKNMKIAQKDYYKKNYDDSIISFKNMKNFDDKNIVILSTGTQGESNSSLKRLASKKHINIDLKKEDVIIFSSSIIPGNDLEVMGLVDDFIRNGNEVVLGTEAKIHASGHGSAEELKLLINAINPKFFFPVHGNLYNMKKHKEIAINVGIKHQNVFLLENGQRVELRDDSVRILERVRLKPTYINNKEIASVDSGLLSSRETMRTSGVLSVAINSGKKKFEIDVKAIGVVASLDIESLEEDLKVLILNYLSNESADFDEKKIRKALLKRICKKTENYGVENPEVVLHFFQKL